MFNFSRNRLVGFCNVKYLLKERCGFNKYLHTINQTLVPCGKKVSLKAVRFNLFSSYKVILSNEHYVNHLCRCFSSKLLNDLKENTDVEKKTEKIESQEISSESSSDDDQSSDFYVVDEQAITNGDPDLLKKLRLCMLEVETYKQEGLDVPSHLKTEHWKELLGLRSRSSKLKFLRFIFINECRKENDKVRKNRKRLKREEELQKLIESTNPDHIRYGIGGNTFFLRIHESTMNMSANNRLVQAMKFGQNLVVDCSYDRYMSKQENNNCAKQIMYLFSINRNEYEPFNIHFTGINPDCQMMKQLEKFIPTIHDWEFPINLHEKSYLELFPKEKLVYLTPHCRNDLKTFDHDAIYIIGGIVDKSNPDPLSLAKAKSEGLRMARFPLDMYLTWTMGSKSLTLDQCVKILHELKSSGNWEKALEHVPKRKVFDENDNRLRHGEEDRQDKSMNFGQSFVASHEWGLNKQQRRTGQRRLDNFDLRTVVSRLKKKVKNEDQ